MAAIPEAADVDCNIRSGQGQAAPIWRSDVHIGLGSMAGRGAMWAAAKLDRMQEPITSRPRRRAVYLLPNLFTTGGLFAGFYAIIAASQGHFERACVAIFIAAILDGIDGRVARMTNTQSDFGMQYDSLADLVSFGMAPALVAWHWSLAALKLDGAVPGKIGWLAAFLYVACAALRLARFNSQVGQVDKRWFVGLASPAAAGLVASYIWTFHDLGWRGGDLRFVTLGVTVAAGLLMVSRLRYSSFKAGGDGLHAERVPFVAMLVAVAALIALVIDPPHVLLAATVLYALSGPVLWRRRRNEPTST